jgi:hypothetical protein
VTRVRPCGPAHEARLLAFVLLILVSLPPLFQGSVSPIGVTFLVLGVLGVVRALRMGISSGDGVLRVANFFRTFTFDIPLDGAIELVPLLGGWPISAHARIRFRDSRRVTIAGISVRSFGGWSAANRRHREVADRLSTVAVDVGLSGPVL